jgi:hypothetical protein
MMTTMCFGSQSFETLARHIHEAENYAKKFETIPHAVLSLDKAQCQVDNKALRLQFKKGTIQAEVDRGCELFSFVSLSELMQPSEVAEFKQEIMRNLRKYTTDLVGQSSPASSSLPLASPSIMNKLFFENLEDQKKLEDLFSDEYEKNAVKHTNVMALFKRAKIWFCETFQTADRARICLKKKECVYPCSVVLALRLFSQFPARCRFVIEYLFGGRLSFWDHVQKSRCEVIHKANMRCELMLANVTQDFVEALGAPDA